MWIVDSSQDQEPAKKDGTEPIQERRVYLCDRCGFEMIETHCKVVCPNCGSRWDCSDLSIYTD
jgi:rubrerythrin